jgi:hypothetical protein
MSLEIPGIRALSLDEWDYVSGGDDPANVPPPGDVSSRGNDVYTQIVGLLGAISPTVWLSPAAAIAGACPDCTFRPEVCTMPDGSNGNQWVSNEIDDFFFPCGEPLPDGTSP